MPKVKKSPTDLIHLEAFTVAQGDEAAEKLATRRRIYAAQRIPEVVAELAQLSEQKRHLAEDRKKPDVDEEARKKLNRKLIYLQMRGDALRAERVLLDQERRTAGQKSIAEK